MRYITRNYICWSHREVVGTTAHSNSLLLLSSKCKLDVIRTLSVYLLLFCANLQEQKEEKGSSDAALSFWGVFLCTHSLYFWRFFSQPPRSIVPRFSTSFFIISLSVWTFCLAKFLWSLRGIPEVQQAVMHMNSWLCGFQIWLMNHVTSYPYQDVHP